MDPSLEPVWAALQREGLTGMDRFGRHLARSGQVRADLSPDEVRDLLWNHLAIDHYERLVLGQRWTTARFGEWLSRSIASAILDPPPSTSPPG